MEKGFCSVSGGGEGILNLFNRINCLKIVNSYLYGNDECICFRLFVLK